MDASPLYDPRALPKYEWDLKDFTKKTQSRTLRPVKYYFTYFDVAQQYEADGPFRTQTGYGWHHVPEFRTQEYCNPFAVDVYRLGMVFREYFTEVCLDYGFILWLS